MEFWLISSALTATPPALAALAGANSRPAFWKMAMASGVEGILAPSATAMAPPLTISSASAAVISF